MPLDVDLLRRVLPGELVDDTLDRDDGQRRQGAGVSLPVADQSGLLGEGLAAYVADVRPLARVDEEVLLLRGPTAEGLLAHRARERLDARVDPHVELEVAPAEPLAARRAEYLLPGLVPDDVLLEVLPGRHAAAADLADELGLVVTVLHVGLQRVEVLAEVAADLADDRRRVAVILLHVVIQRLLYLELLAALVARVLVVARVQPYEVVLQGPLVRAPVVADVALVDSLAMAFVDVGAQLAAESESPRTIRACATVQPQVSDQATLLRVLLTAVVALDDTARWIVYRFSDFSSIGVSSRDVGFRKRFGRWAWSHFRFPSSPRPWTDRVLGSALDTDDRMRSSPGNAILIDGRASKT